METINRLLGLRIKELRQNKKLSQEGLSDKVGVDPKYVSRIEVGKATPSLSVLVKIARELTVEIKDLFEFSHFELEGRELDVQTLLQDLPDEKRQLIIKLIKAVVN